MNPPKISQRRLRNQQVSHSHFQSANELLQWMGAIQAQDYEMAKWALGVRLPGSTRNTLEKAIKDGRIIRTHILRPTWHFVAAENLRWMLELTAPRIRVSMKSRRKQLGITNDVILKSNKSIEKALAKNKEMTRSELVTELKKAGLKNENNRASHLLTYAELDKVICSGPSRGNKYTYALFEERVPPRQPTGRDDALAKLASIYFSSHGPATLEDFVWWSGLTKTGARKALEFAKENLYSEKINSELYWFSDSPNITEFKNNSFLLPAYDEFLISYCDRSASIKIKDQKKAISNNGIFRPIIVVNGEVTGIWKRSVKNNTVYVEIKFFTAPSKRTVNQIGEAAEKFAGFLEMDLKVSHRM